MSDDRRPWDSGELPAGIDRAVLDALPFGAVITDSTIDSPGPRLLYVNPEFCAMTGYSPSQVLGRSPRFLQGPETSRAVLDRLRSALSEEAPFDGETWNYRADGSAFIMQWTVDPVRSTHDGRLYFFAVQRDVTELRRLEAIAEASNLMENVGYIFAGIRHELGNPINSVKAAVTLLRRGLDHYSKERVSGTLDRVLDELQRVEYLLRELRSFNAFEEPVRESVEIVPFLERFVGLVRTDVEERGCDLHLHSEDAPSRAYFDPRGLHQVLLNLVTNAMEAVAGAGRLSLDDANARSARGTITITVRSGREGRCTIEVDDDGPGASQDTVARMFMPFFTTKPSGTGLGLALVKRVLARMGASLEVRSQLEMGTTFLIDLPSPP